MNALRLRVKGRGVKTAKGQGDLLATVEVAVPSHLSGDAQRKLEEFVEMLPAENPREDLLARFHARDRQGRLVSGAEAFLVVWGATPGLRWLEGLRRFRPLVLVLEGAYRIFLRLRPRLQSLARHVER